VDISYLTIFHKATGFNQGFTRIADGDLMEMMGEEPYHVLFAAS
jgi:hypothetical protein